LWKSENSFRLICLPLLDPPDYVHTNTHPHKQLRLIYLFCVQACICISLKDFGLRA